MAWGILAKPGDYDHGGPCIDECTHVDCLATRTMAMTRCFHCKEVIGFETKFLKTDVRGLVHFVCECEFQEAQDLLDKMSTAMSDQLKGGDS